MSIRDFYERPGKIINVNISEPSEADYFCVKPNLQEAYDYVKVNEHVWNYLKEWYGYDIETCIEFEIQTPTSY